MEADGHDDAACRLRALFRAAAVRTASDRARIAQFAGTTAAPEVTQNDPVKAERSNYFDVGISQVIDAGPDGRRRCLLQDIEQPDRRGPVRRADHPDRVQLRARSCRTGVELTASYDRGPWSLYGNLAWSRAMGKDIVSAQFNFGADELAFIGNNFIHLDHDQTWTVPPAPPTR